MTEIINKIVEFNELESRLVEYKRNYIGLVYDFDKQDEVDSAKENQKSISKVIKNLEDTRKELKSEAKKQVDLIDGEGKRIRDQLEEMRDDIKNQRELHASVAIKHAAALQLKIDEINDLTVFEEGVFVNVNDRLEEAKNHIVDSSFEDREPDGHMAKAKAVELLEGKLLLHEKRVKEAADLEKREAKERQEREENIRKDVEEKAAKEKEAAALKAEQDAKLAREKAEKDKADAVKAEQDKAEKAAKEKERIVKKEVERLQSIADEEVAKLKAKQENQEHRAQIHKEAKISLIAAGLNHATDIVTAIKDGKIKNITINY